jgi:YihY family inner membrane protein
VDLLRPVRALDRHQQKRKWLAIPFAVIKKFGDDQAGNLAALMAYYAFFSLFPLLLVFVTILGFVLQGNPSAQKSVADSVVGQLPIIKDQISLHSLNGSAVPLVIGLLTSLWAGLGITNAAQNAFDRVWAVPFKHRADFLHARLRGVALLIMLGALFLVSSLASGLVTGGLGGPVLKVVGIALSLALNFALFAAAFRLLTSDTVGTSSLWAGVAVAAVLWEILQVGQGVFIGHVLKNGSSTYGTFGFVIALLIWLHLGAQITLYAAEINVVLTRKLWPRSLFSPAVPADEKTLAALALVEERDDREKIEVHFEDSDGEPPGSQTSGESQEPSPANARSDA